MTKEYIKQLYDVDFKNHDIANGARWKLHSLGLLTQELADKLEAFNKVYNDKMEEIAQMAINQFSPRLKELLSEQILRNHVFPTINKDNQIGIKVGSNQYGVSLLMDITTLQLYYDSSISWSVSDRMENRDEVVTELNKIISHSNHH